MKTDSDFLTLYQQLDISPDCAPDEFRRAYRRRVAQLHPDRPTSQEQNTPDLQHLNALYSAAIQFHRQHGRLPGAAHSAAYRPRASSAQLSAATAVRPKRRYLLALMIILLLAATLLYLGIEESTNEMGNGIPTSGPSTRASVTRAASSSASQLRLGMRSAEVRAIQGEPVTRHDELWEFGPSWITFECGVVSNWYSSPLRPLKVSSTYPPETTQLAVAKRVGDCRDRTHSSTSGFNSPDSRTLSV